MDPWFWPWPVPTHEWPVHGAISDASLLRGLQNFDYFHTFRNVEVSVHGIAQHPRTGLACLRWPLFGIPGPCEGWGWTRQGFVEITNKECLRIHSAKCAVVAFCMPGAWSFKLLFFFPTLLIEPVSEHVRADIHCQRSWHGRHGHGNLSTLERSGGQADKRCCQKWWHPCTPKQRDAQLDVPETLDDFHGLRMNKID